MLYEVVVPYLFLVWYNVGKLHGMSILVVVPYLFLVWYNAGTLRCVSVTSCSSLFIFGMV